MVDLAHARETELRDGARRRGPTTLPARQDRLRLALLWAGAVVGPLVFVVIEAAGSRLP
jgi:hypothetical protein